MPQLLPGVAPTGRHVQLAFCVVVGFADGKVAHEHIYWDQASLLVQVGLLDPSELPVTGAEQAGNVLDPRARPLNELIRAQPQLTLAPQTVPYSASTMRTNSFVSSNSPRSRTARAPWYQPASASRRSPPNSSSCQRR